MTQITHDQTGIAVRLRRLVVGLLVAGSVFAATATDSVDARSRSTSEVVAAEAERAVNALDSWQTTQDPADYVLFVRARAETASMVASELEVDPGLLTVGWASTSTEKQRTLLAALSQLGVPYRSMKSVPGVGFDCSGLTSWAFGEAGLDIPRVSRDQINAADKLEHDAAEAGDLVYYPGHVAIYLGADLMVHSPNSGSHVEVVQIPTRRSLRYGDIASVVIEAEAASAGELPAAALMDGAAPVSK
jgi:cell wall-associated NlpC family hydrolase